MITNLKNFDINNVDQQGLNKLIAKNLSKVTNWQWAGSYALSIVSLIVSVISLWG